MKTIFKLKTAVICGILILSAFTGKLNAQSAMVCGGYYIINNNNFYDVEISYEVIDNNCNSLCSGIHVPLPSGTQINISNACCPGAYDIYVTVTAIGPVGSSPTYSTCPSYIGNSVWGGSGLSCAGGVNSNLHEQTIQPPVSGSCYNSVNNLLLDWHPTYTEVH